MVIAAFAAVDDFLALTARTEMLDCRTRGATGTSVPTTLIALDHPLHTPLVARKEQLYVAAPTKPLTVKDLAEAAPVAYTDGNPAEVQAPT